MKSEKEKKERYRRTHTHIRCVCRRYGILPSKTKNHTSWTAVYFLGSIVRLVHPCSLVFFPGLPFLFSHSRPSPSPPPSQKQSSHVKSLLAFLPLTHSDQQKRRIIQLAWIFSSHVPSFFSPLFDGYLFVYVYVFSCLYIIFCFHLLPGLYKKIQLPI